jgi:hypothetical protein
MNLNKNDYITILKFYKVDITALSSKAIKEKAEHLLAVKLCKCIKNIRGTAPNAKVDKAKVDKAKVDKAKVDNANGEKRAIAICYNSVITKKKLKIYKFTCKKKVKLIAKKGKGKGKGTRKIFVEKLQ